MADYNRNRQDAYRQQNDWNDDYGRQQSRYEDEPNYTISENRGYRDSGRHGSMSSGDGGWQSRYERQMNSNREGDFDGGSGHGFYGRHSERDYGYGTGQRGLSSAYSDFGGDYSRGERGGSRNLYDRGDQGMSRRDYENSENRIGGANYDRYGDRSRYNQGQPYGGGYGDVSSGTYGSRPNYGRYDRGNEHRGRNYGRGDYRDRDYGRGESEERSWWDKTTDEVSSWFGDDDAARRRESDKNHRGKGPRNYTRSDDRIKEDINDRLSDDPFIDASDIDVSVTKGEVVLTGSVDHRSSKRRAEDLAESVSGVRNVENRIRVAQITGNQASGVSGMNNPSGSAGSSSSPVPGSDRGRTRETSKTT